ncbi:MAG: hypothetical protein ACYC77_10325 [Coriobacteriia bacterium]
MMSFTDHAIDEAAAHPDLVPDLVPKYMATVGTPTQSVMDRLTHYFAWGDRQALDQAIMIARRHPLDWDELSRWITQEVEDLGVLDTVRSKADLT